MHNYVNISLSDKLRYNKNYAQTSSGYVNPYAECRINLSCLSIHALTILI